MNFFINNLNDGWVQAWPLLACMNLWLINVQGNLAVMVNVIGGSYGPGVNLITSLCDRMHF